MIYFWHALIILYKRVFKVCKLVNEPQRGILTSVDSYEPVQPSFKLRNSKCCSVSSLTVIEYSSDLQRL